MRKILAFALLSAVAPSALGVVVLDEQFNHVDHAALIAAWSQRTLPASGDNDFYRLDTAVGNPAGSYALVPPTANSTGRIALNLGGSYNGTDANPLELSVDMLLEDVGTNAANFWSNARQFVEFRGYAGGSLLSGALQNLVAVGVFNTSDDGAFSTLKYQGRALGTPDVPATDWSTLTGAANRAVGWHNLKVIVDTDSYDFYVDDVLGKSVARNNAFPFDSVVLGSDLTAGTAPNQRKAWVDNVRVEVTPEPASIALLAIGALALRRRR